MQKLHYHVVVVYSTAAVISEVEPCKSGFVRERFSAISVHILFQKRKSRFDEIFWKEDGCHATCDPTVSLPIEDLSSQSFSVL